MAYLNSNANTNGPSWLSEYEYEYESPLGYKANGYESNSRLQQQARLSTPAGVKIKERVVVRRAVATGPKMTPLVRPTNGGPIAVLAH